MLNIPPRASSRSRSREPRRREPGGVLKQLKTDGCISCHQVGNKPTREIDAGDGTVRLIVQAWTKRVTFGPDGGQMDQQLTALGRQRGR